jgi:orotidine-5'-phosphate decarboxylase
MNMKRPKDYIVFPLDMPSFDDAMRYVERLKAHIGLFKVGLELFISEGPSVLRAIREAGGAGIFLDLKLHDIPETVRRALAAASAHAPELVTIHCDEGGDTLRSAVEKKGGSTKILAVTVLTSLDQKKLRALGYADAYVEDISALVLLKARMAKEAGCHGVVCSGLEVARIKAELGPDFLAVTPGIRPAWSVISHDDQRRIVTPADAVKNGSDFVVIGRPIRDAGDPSEAAARVAEEIAQVL